MNRLFPNHQVRKKFIITLFVIVCINVFSLWSWYGLKIKPAIDGIENTKEILMDEKIKKSYSTFSAFEENLESLMKEYPVLFQVINEKNQIVKESPLEKNRVQLFTIFVQVEEQPYRINAYSSQSLSFAHLIFSLIAFQIFIILLLTITTYLFTGHSIITPIEKIINDIRDYQFGKKPIRNAGNSELDIIQNEFVHLVDSLEKEKQEQKRIIASISHDIKTPLTSIIGYSSLMEDDLSAEEVKEYSTKVHEKALHIKDILTSFDDYLVNYDHKKLKLTVISIKDVIQKLMDDYKFELNNKNIEFNITSHCEKEKINIDLVQIKRVFSNIISNSIKYVPPQGKIDILIEKKKQFIVFSISDNGTGVEEENLKKIFDPFFTTDASRKISGLGLSICKEFIEMHGGTIEAINNHGLTIRFQLPIYKEKKN